MDQLRLIRYFIVWMLKDYKQVEVLDAPSENCTLYKASKKDKLYLMYELQDYKQADEYTFLVLQKLKTCANLVHILETFELEGKKYYITDYVEEDLLKLQFQQKNKVISLPMALQYYAQIINIIEELHQNRLVYRNLRMEAVKMVDNVPYLSDFSFSEFSKRKERMFDKIGVSYFLAPEFFTEDGYGKEIDIWASGVLLFFMLFFDYPFSFKTKEEAAYREEFEAKCSKGFDLQTAIKQTKNPAHLNANPHLQDFFEKVFEMSYAKRITISEIKKHKLFEGYFENSGFDEMGIIEEVQGDSIFMSKIQTFSFAEDFKREMHILDFLQETSEVLMIECGDIVPEPIRAKTKFAILKIAMIKISNILNFLYGTKPLAFQIDMEEWEKGRNTTASKFIKQGFEKRRNILNPYFKTSALNLQGEKNEFFNENIPDTFSQVKISYRRCIESFFEGIKQAITKKGLSRQRVRRLTEHYTQIIMLHFINRIFEKEDVEDNFSFYITWNKSTSFDRINEWIESETLKNLKEFIKKCTNKYN